MSPGRCPWCGAALTATGLATGASLVAELTAEPSAVPIAWCTFGPPCINAYFPVFLDANLPGGALAAKGRTTRCGGPARPARIHGCQPGGLEEGGARPVALVQRRFDYEAEEFIAEAMALKQAARGDEVSRLAGLLMQSHIEQFQEAMQWQLAAGRRIARPRP